MGLLKPRTAVKLVFHGDDLEVLSELRRAVMRAEAALVEAEAQAERAARGPRRLGDVLPDTEEKQAALQAARDDYDAATDDAATRAVEVRLTAIGSQRYRTLVAEHGPREGDDGETLPEDAEFGVNVETFPRALLTFRDEDAPHIRTITDPDVSPADLAEFLDDEVSEGDFEELWVTAFALNKSQGVDPRLGKYSAATPTSSVN